MKNLQVHFSSATDMWSTPQGFFDKIDEEFNFTLDPCATPENAKSIGIRAFIMKPITMANLAKTLRKVLG